MKDYTIYITKEIAKKAINKNFGYLYDGLVETAPEVLNNDKWYYLPTAEQICGWLREEKGFVIGCDVRHKWNGDSVEKYYTFILFNTNRYTNCSDYEVEQYIQTSSYEEGLLQCIDKAIDLI